MAKTHSLPFDLRNIVLAFNTAEAHANAFDAMCADMLHWHAAGVYPSNDQIKTALVAVKNKDGSTKYKAASASVYASAILKWARSGQTPSTLHACINGTPKGHIKSTRGRKAKNAVEKAVAATAPASIAVPLESETVSPMHGWMVKVKDLGAAAFMLRNARNEPLSVEDAKALQDAVNTIAALLGKYTK